MLARSIAVGALVLAGCYDVPTPVCGFACVHDQQCPEGYTCQRSDDGRCHLNGYESVNCKDVPIGPDDDFDPPQLQFFQPTSSAESTLPFIDVVFDEPVKHVDSSSYFLTDDSDPAETHMMAGVGSNSSSEWSLNLTFSLEFGRSYTVHLTTAITDEANNHYAGITYGFTVMSDGPPRINFQQFIQPIPNQTDVPVNTFVAVTMSEQVQTLAGKFHLISNVSGSEVPAVIDNPGVTMQASLEPVEQLLPRQLYAVQIDADVTDLTGNPMGFTDGWSFTTGDDFIPPQLRETSPKASSVAPVTTIISVLFDEAVASINQFSVTNGATTFPGTLVSSNGGRTWAFTPSAALPANTVITVSITGATDTSGNMANFVYNFTTAP